MSISNNQILELEKIAQRIKIKIIKMLTISGGGHAGGSMSAVEILTSLYFHEMKFNPKNHLDENRDRFILSKGHASPALYAVFSEIGFLTEDSLWTLHEIDGPLQMHPERGLCPGVEMSTGALGQGLSAGIGMALGARIKGKDFRVYVLIGDGEMDEGQIWEAAMSASKFKLDNLTTIIDYNKFSLTSSTKETMPLEPLADKWKSFGWNVLEINGHKIPEILEAFKQAKEVKGKPTIIIANTFKGHNIPSFENTAASHSVSFTLDQVKETLQSLGCNETEIETTISKMK
ncbi:MAG: transketolase [Melioribacteraceae bacterium]|nr:transketolase [Melioribacteraceae bacterium]